MGRAGVARDRKTAPTEVIGCILARGPEGKMEILACLLILWWKNKRHLLDLDEDEEEESL